MDTLISRDIEELATICPGCLYRNQSLAALTSWKIGGMADLIIRPSTTRQVAVLRAWFWGKDFPHVVFGATTNLLFADEGLRVPAIQIGPELSRSRIQGTTLFVQAGAWVPGIARMAMQNGLTGIEHVAGIPGTFGGLVAMNGGSNRLSIGSSITEVESVSTRGDVFHRTAADCDFRYRHSVFQRNDEIITSATLVLAEGDKGDIRNRMLRILQDRGKKFPRKLPNCGSVFKSNPAMYEEVGTPGSAIERVGLKGYRIGNAQISPQHANFIVNNGGATAADVGALIEKAKSKVAEVTGYTMETEVLYVSPEGQVRPADALLER